MKHLITHNELTMSSLEIAELTDKDHKNVMRDIRNMLETLELDRLRFEHMYLDRYQREQKAYQLPKDLCLTLVSGYNVVLRKKIIDRWLELEQEKPTLPDFNNPAAAARAWAEVYEKQQHTQQQLHAAQPAVNFVERYVEAGGFQTLTQVAKVLGRPPRKFITLLEHEKVLYRRKGERIPYQYYIDQAYFSVKTGENNGHAWVQTLVTPRGVNWLSRRYGQELVA